MGEKEMHEELVGVLTAISIVSKRLANRLLVLKNQEAEVQGNNDERGEKYDES